MSYTISPFNTAKSVTIAPEVVMKRFEFQNIAKPKKTYPKNIGITPIRNRATYGSDRPSVLMKIADSL